MNPLRVCFCLRHTEMEEAFGKWSEEARRGGGGGGPPKNFEILPRARRLF
jgi:hypothetical protein